MGETLLVWWLGAIARLPSLVGLAFNVVAWALLLDYLRRMTTSRPILDGKEVADDDHPFA